MAMLSNTREKQLKKFLTSVHINCGLENLDIALTHSSYCHENNLSYELCNERLEFLGDSVLKLVISNYLFKIYPNYHEGDLSQVRSNVVSDETLSKIAKTINLQDYITLGQAEETNNGRLRSSTIACAFEALLGAMYLDSGLTEIIKFIEELFAQEIDRVDKEGLKNNTKALLQEYYQSFSNDVPEYVLTKQIGPPHDRTFFVDVLFQGEFLASGVGVTKKAAQKDAAAKACENLGLLAGENNE